jgi:hypothetical protein
MLLRQREAMLRNLGEQMQKKIKKICKKDRGSLQSIYDNWKVYVDPNAEDLVNRVRTGYGHTTFSTQQTRFNWAFFNSTPTDPSSSFSFAHEFRHLMKANNDLPNTDAAVGMSALGETDADAWAGQFLSGSCSCE